ncbi:glycoside hydrolase family protein [Venturia nashicola]|nr:glycoside hydrolase family protein [Venturia nashicola]
MYNHFKTPFFDKGGFPLTDSNGTHLDKPWQGGSDATPFDQDFYLILDVAVGGTNAWFKDGASGKPWVDGEESVLGCEGRVISNMAGEWTDDCQERQDVAAEGLQWMLKTPTMRWMNLFFGR